MQVVDYVKKKKRKKELLVGAVWKLQLLNLWIWEVVQGRYLVN